jgi:ABC-type sulfate/molybdate transport systems ATPase subunit
MGLRVEIEKRLPGFTLELAFEAGAEPLGILGASGSGKTLTLLSIAGLENPTRGSITLNGRVLFDSAARVNLPSRTRRVGLVFQNYALFPHLTVAENIAFGIAHLPKEDQRRIIGVQVQRARLAGLESRYLRELSGGQQQRAALARALATNPEVLLLDEPFSALDTHLRSQMEREFRDALAEYRGVILFVGHNLEEVYRICSNLLILSGGKPAAFGPKEEVFRRPPNLVAAQLTGCKNFSRACAAGEHSVEALDWGVMLRVDQNIPRPLGHAALRAHYIRFAAAPAASDLNVFPCWLAATSESPFRITLYLKLNAPPATPADYHLQAEVTKDVWAEIETQAFPWHVQLDPARLFLLPD